MNRRLIVLGTLALLGAKPWKTKDEPIPEPVVAPVEAPEVSAGPPPWEGTLFPGALPLDPGPLAPGLASASAQACNACHWEAHDGWSGSAHAAAHEDSAFRAAVATVGTPACQGCHQPLSVQYPALTHFDVGDPNRPLSAPNPVWDATLAAEGVTCVACHLRDGVILAPRPPRGPAPHPIRVAEQLGASETCAGCHQLSWPGEDKPFYDTWGEWSRSPQAAVGIQCQDCHMAPGAGRDAVPDHSLDASFGRGLSLHVQPSTDVFVRGGPALGVTLTARNTGAGHSLPTGSPWGSVRITARWVREVKPGVWEPQGAPFHAELARRFEPTPPYRTLSDTRLAPGQAAEFTWEATLDAKAPAGSWAIEAFAQRHVMGEARDAPVLLRRVPIRVE